MNDYTISYTIENSYEKLVKKAFFQLMVLPCEDARQEILDFEISCSLQDTEHRTSNLFGFSLLQYTSAKPIQAFRFQLDFNVRIDHHNPYDFLTAQPDEEIQIMQDDSFWLEHALFLRPTDLVDLKKADALQFLSFNPSEGVFAFLQQLNQLVYSRMNYQADVTTTKTKASELLAGSLQGVCQDYAHLFLAVARANQIPCRYVSGYLNQGGTFLGTSQTHAWVEALIPQVGWVGFDPTNNLLVDHHYIKIAHGTDYKDCSPIAGVLETTGEQRNTHVVTVINQ